MAEFKVASAYADFEVRVDEGIDKAKVRIKQRQRELDAEGKIRLDVDLKDAKAKIKSEFRDERFTIKADADTTLARARLEKLTGEGTFKIKPDVDEPAARKAAQQLDGTVSRMANRANAQFDLLKFTAFTIGLPAAAAAGAAGVTAAIGGIGLAWGGLVVALTSGTDEVSASWGSFSDGVIRDARAMANPLKGEVVGAIDEMGSAWTRIKPIAAAGMGAAAPGLREVVAAADDFIENAAPGLIAGAKASGTALKGVHTFAAQAGAGLSDFALNATKGVDGANRGMVVLGGTVQTLEGRLGQLFANLATGSVGPLRSLDVILDHVTGSMVDATAAGSGVMGAFQGATTAGSGLVTILHGVVAATSALPPQLTQLGGSWAATNMIASQFGINAGKGFEGLGTKIQQAEGFSKKLGTTVGGLAAGAINPAFLAVTALSLGLSALGEAQEKAAQYAAEHRDNVRSLTEALRQDGGVVGETIRQRNAQALADKNASANLSAFGQNISNATAAIYGSSYAYQQLRSSSVDTLTSIADQAGIVKENRQEFIGLGDEALKTGKNYDQLKNNVLEAGKSYDSSGESAQRFSASQLSTIEATLNAMGAVGEQINAQKQAKEGYYLTEQALTNLSRAQIEARDATIEHTKATQDAIGGQLGYRGTVEQTKQALADYKKVSENTKSTEDQKAQSLLGVENAMYRQVQAAGQAAAANANVKSENERAMVATQAMNRETVNLANSWAGPLPQSLQAGIAKMTTSEARAAGLTVAIDNTGAAVYRLPNGKDIRIESNAEQERARVEALRASIDALHNRDIKITTTYFYGTAGGGANLNGPYVARAQGGLVGRLAAAHGRLYADGVDAVAPIQGGLMGALGRSIRDVIPTLLTPGEHVTNSKDTANNISELAAINAGQRNYRRWPETGRPPERAETPRPRSEAPVINMGGVTLVGADPDEVLSKFSNRLSWAVRR